MFQDRFKSEPVEDDGYFLTVIRYIHQNPVKAGICKKVQDYEYSSYNEYFCDSVLINSSFVFDFVNKTEFVRFNNEKSIVNCLDIEDKVVVKVTDEQAKRIIEKYSKCKSVSDFQVLSSKLKEKYIRKFHQHGISIRQISRLCGETKGMVEKWTKL